jgi:putative tryptophan/tyrosine transport system substrate-binding protein
MSRRAFVAGAGAALAAPLAVGAQTPAQVFRIGVLGVGTPELGALLVDGLREAGYIEGRNVALEWRNPEGRSDRFDALAADLVRRDVDVIVAMTPAATLAARRATASIPIVMVNTPDPVQLGLATSLARPGGNVTGTTTLSVDLTAKQLELLREVAAGVTRIAVLWVPTNPWHPRAVENAGGAARRLGLRLTGVEVRTGEELEGAFATVTRERLGAILSLSDPMTFFHRARLAELAMKHRLPSMHGVRGYADAGGLMSYWAHTGDLYRRVVSYVDRILKGSRPAELPVEQPTRFQLVVNLRTAKALGRTIPQSLLQRADEVLD